MGGRLYVDGSCTCETIRELRRAGCSGVEMSNNGEMLAKCTVPLPRHFRQTPQAAEHVGFAVNVRLLGRRTVVHQDCRAVVNAANDQLRSALAPRRKYAGITMDARTHDNFRMVDEVKWVKAHCKIRDDMTLEEKVNVWGNEAADAAAKEAVGRHPQRDREQEALLKYYDVRAPLIVRAVGTALSLFPPVSERMTRSPSSSTARESGDARKHKWQFEEGTWRCTTCATWVASHRLGKTNRREACSGPNLDDRAAEFEGLGHRLCRTSGSVPIIFCSRCGAWSSRRPRKLKKPCTSATEPGRQALARLAKGQRPWIRPQRGGGIATRGWVGPVAAFGGSQEGWKEDTGRGTKRKLAEDGTPSRRRTEEAELYEHPPQSCGDVTGEDLVMAEVGPMPPEVHELMRENDNEADEEAAAALGRTGSLDEPSDDRHGPRGDNGEQRTLGDAAGREANNEMHDKGQEDGGLLTANEERGVKRKGTAHFRGEAAGRKARAREAAKEERNLLRKEATKRAIEELGQSLSPGPRDAAERLEALRRRIRNKQDGAVKTQEPREGAVHVGGELGKQQGEAGGGRVDDKGNGSQKRKQLHEETPIKMSYAADDGGYGDVILDPTASSSSAPWRARTARGGDGADGRLGGGSGSQENYTGKKRRGTIDSVHERERSGFNQQRRTYGFGDEEGEDLRGRGAERGRQHDRLRGRLCGHGPLRQPVRLHAGLRELHDGDQCTENLPSSDVEGTPVPSCVKPGWRDIAADGIVTTRGTGTRNDHEGGDRPQLRRGDRRQARGGDRRPAELCEGADRAEGLPSSDVEGTAVPSCVNPGSSGMASGELPSSDVGTREGPCVHSGWSIGTCGDLRLLPEGWGGERDELRVQRAGHGLRRGALQRPAELRTGTQSDKGLPSSDVEGTAVPSCVNSGSSGMASGGLPSSDVGTREGPCVHPGWSDGTCGDLRLLPEGWGGERGEPRVRRAGHGLRRGALQRPAELRGGTQSDKGPPGSDVEGAAAPSCVYSGASRNWPRASDGRDEDQGNRAKEKERSHELEQRLGVRQRGLQIMEDIEEEKSDANYFEKRLPSSDVGGATAPPCVNSGSSGAEGKKGKQDGRKQLRDHLRGPAVGRWAVVGGRWRPISREGVVHDGGEAEDPVVASRGGELDQRKRPGIYRARGEGNGDEATTKVPKKIRTVENSESKAVSGAASRAPTSSTNGGRPLVDDAPRHGCGKHGSGGSRDGERDHEPRNCGGDQGDEEAKGKPAGEDCDTVERQAARLFVAAGRMPKGAESLGQASSSALIDYASGGYEKGGAVYARGNLNVRELAPVQAGGVHARDEDLAEGSGRGRLGGAGSSAGAGARGGAAARGCSWERGGAARGGALPRGPRREA